MEKFDVVVVGAGAAGLLAAGRAAQGGASVLLLERHAQAGRKILITGKGRCNITNTSAQSEYYKNIFPNGRFLKHAFGNFFAKDILALLNAQGLATAEERGDRAFPASNSAKDVRDTLLHWGISLGVEVRYEHQVTGILADTGRITGIRASLKGGPAFDISCQAVIFCPGGCSYPATGSDGNGYRLIRALGHHVESIRPALVPLETAGTMAQELQGLSLKNVKAVLWINDKKKQEEFGEMLFTHFGLSGPIILTMSRTIVQAVAAGDKIEVSIDLKPALDERQLDQRLVRDLNTYGKKRLENVFRLWLPSKMISVFITHLNIDPHKEAHQLGAAERKKVMLMMKNLRFSIIGHRSFKEAIITAGGVSLKEIEPKTLESKRVKNLFFAGEVMDLDANTGGYNLQIAWSTGWLAGLSAAAAVVNHDDQ